MRAVRARTRDDLRLAVEQQRRARVLDRGRQRLDARDHAARVRRLQPHQHRRDVGAGEHAGQARRQ